MFLPDAEVFEAVRDIPRQQLSACAMRYGERPTPSFRLIGLRLGVSRQRAHDLTRKGLARLRAKGVDVSRLIGRTGELLRKSA